MDRITKSLLAEFSEDNSLFMLNESKKFEHFASYLLTSRHFTDSFSSEDVCVGGGGDIGIDGISIIVNGCLVTEPEEVGDLCETNGYLEAVFIFVQAETSSSFETAKIGQFIFGVSDFLSETPALPRNADIDQKTLVLNAIYEQSSKFRRGNPNCYLYYATTGKWVDDENLTIRMKAAKDDLDSLGILNKVQFECIDAEAIHKLYRESKNAISCEIDFPIRTELSEIPGIEQAYIGVLPVSQYLKLIQNSDEEIIHSLFYDNVRHWQEWTPVNKEIRDTLHNPDKRIYFPIFNNGVTIVAKNIGITRHKFLLEDYQIVNGCQTSYVLYESKSNLDDDIEIPIRLIATKDQDIKNAIIKATNRQTQVTDEQLFALTDFPKKLEDFFPSFEPSRRLYYERRSRQYNSVEGIEKVRVINMTALVRSFASVFLDLPHRTTRNYKALLKSIGTDIFNIDHTMEPYYVSAFAHYRLEYLFRSHTIDRELKAARYHILMCFRYLATDNELPRFYNSHSMSYYCNELMEVLWDENKYKEKFSDAERIIRLVADGNLHRDNIRTEPFTEKVLNQIRAEKSD
jgi:AIPR protein